MKITCPVCNQETEVSMFSFRIKCEHCKKELEIMTPWLFETIQWTTLLFSFIIIIQSKTSLQKGIGIICLVIGYLLLIGLKSKLVQIGKANIIEIRSNMEATLSQIRYHRHPLFTILIDTYGFIALSVLLPYVWVKNSELSLWYLFPFGIVSIFITFVLHLCFMAFLKKIGWIKEIRR